MYTILRFLFSDKPYTAGNSWLLLAVRIIFGGLLMSHRQVAELRCAFRRVSRSAGCRRRCFARAGDLRRSRLFCRVYRGVVLPAGSYPDDFHDVRGFLRRTRRRSVRGARTGAGLSVGLRADVRRRSRSLCGRYADCSASSEAAAVVAPHPYPDSAPIPSLPEEAMDVCRIFAGRMPRARQANSLSAR